MSKAPETPETPPLFILQCFGHGLRLCFNHVRLLALLSSFPFFVTLVTMVAMRFAGDDVSLFWVPIIQMPSSFVVGLECALILRFVVLHEYPVLTEDTERRSRNRAVAQGAFVYMAVNYLLTGAYAGLLKLRAGVLVNPETAAPYLPLMIAILVLLMWAMRWFWLHVPVALEWSVSGFYQRVGKWTGSFRVFGLFMLCALMVNFVAGIATWLLSLVAGSEPGGFAAAFQDAIISASVLLLAVLFTLSTAAAVKIMAGTKTKDIEV